jgi:hypothetical protein
MENLENNNQVNSSQNSSYPVNPDTNANLPSGLNERITQKNTEIKHNRSRRGLFIFVVFSFLILIGLGIFWWLQTTKSADSETGEVDQKNEIVLEEEKEKIDKSGWHEIEDTYWAFNMSFPEDLRIIKIGDHDGWKSEDDESFFMTMEGSDIIVDFSDLESYEPLVQQFELSEEFVEGEVIIVNGMYAYNFIMDYPEDRGLMLYRGMKEHFMFIKNDHVFSILFLLDKNGNINEQRIKNRSIVDTLKFFEPVATGLDDQISKFSQSTGLSTVILQGTLTEDKALYPDYNYSHNIRNNDEPVDNYLNTEYGQIVLYANDKLSCPKYISVEGSLYGLKPIYDPDKNYLGYYMEVLNYECLENIGDGLDEDIVFINDDNLDEIDTDGDGLNDALEAIHSTDPNNPDTDGDGYTDGEEVANGYNPLGEGVLTTDELNDWGVSSEEQASRKSKISELLNLSTIYYDDNLTYLDFCISSEVGSIKNDLGVTNFSCVSKFEAWAASVKLAENKYWCVNSDYQPKETSLPVSNEFCL